jgi:acetyl esterase/lipase
MDNDPALELVMAHLKTLAQSVSVPNIKVAERRELIDKYFAVNQQVLTCTISPIKVQVGHCDGYWFVPDQHDGKKRLLYIHGGSWMSGSVKGWGAFMGQIANATGCAVLFIEYALMPEHPFPQGLEDCLNAYHWLMEHGPTKNEVCHKTYMAGDSAGGNLTLACLLALKERGENMPDAALAISPCTDLTASGDSMQRCQHLDPIINPGAIKPLAQAYVQGNQDHNHPLISPLFGQLAGLPPLMIQTGEAEVLLDDSVRFAHKAKTAGVKVVLETWPNMPHVFQGFAPFLKQANQALKSIGGFISDH